MSGKYVTKEGYHLRIVLMSNVQAVPSKYMALLKEASNLMNPRHNYGNYREVLRTVKAPCIPFVSLVLRDVIHVEGTLHLIAL